VLGFVAKISFTDHPSGGDDLTHFSIFAFEFTTAGELLILSQEIGKLEGQLLDLDATVFDFESDIMRMGLGENVGFGLPLFFGNFLSLVVGLSVGGIIGQNIREHFRELA